MKRLPDLTWLATVVELTEKRASTRVRNTEKYLVMCS